MKIKLLFTLILCLGICSCSTTKQQDKIEVKFGYKKTILPNDITKLWIAEGDSTKQIVAIFLQGGPKDELDFEKRGKSSWRYLPDFNNYYKIHLHQANTLNTDMFKYKGDFTIDMARAEVDNSSEILYRAIKYFKDKGKTVWVMGHSYGAYIIPHYLSTRPSLADKYVIISGRIDDPKNVISAHKKGFNGEYVDGINFVSEENNKDFTGYNRWAKKYYTAKQLLKAAIGEIQYSKALKNVDLSSTIYIYNPKDKRVGGLTDNEVAFLKSKKAPVYTSKWEHGYTIRELVDLVEAGTIKL